MNFASDNWSGASPQVMAALTRHNQGFMPSYGGDPVSAGVARRLAALFETELEVTFTATGTAANAIAMAGAARTAGLIFCSQSAHIFVDEWGASEFYTGGMKLVPIDTRFGKLSAKALQKRLDEIPEGSRFGRPTILSITQATEAGTLYSVEQIAGLCRIARSRGMLVHMDGARFANALVALGTTPAEMTWKAGVDILSFGGTKNGCWAAEAILCFKPDLFPDLRLLRARAGHLLSKSRFVAAQFEGYLEADLWLANARHANAMAQKLAIGLERRGAARLAWATEANEVFAVLGVETAAALRGAGANFHVWAAETTGPDLRLGEADMLVRLVTSFATTGAEVEQFIDLLPDATAGLAAILSPPL